MGVGVFLYGVWKSIGKMNTQEERQMLINYGSVSPSSVANITTVAYDMKILKLTLVGWINMGFASSQQEFGDS